MQEHEAQYQRERGERHRGDRDVDVGDEVDIRASRSDRRAGDDRAAAELQIHVIRGDGESDGRERETRLLGEVLKPSHVLFFAREQREEKDHRLRVEQSALDPAELAWRKVREFGIE